MALPVAEEEVVAAAVVRVEGRVGHLTVVVARPADEEVEVAVAVHVREREGARRALRDDAGRGRDLLERAVAAVPEEAGRAEGVRHGEIREAVAVDVARRRRRSPRCRRCPTTRGRRAPVTSVKCPLPSFSVEDRPDAVAHEEVLVAVPVEVEDRDARARPDAVDEAVRELLRRIAAGRAEARRERRVVEAGTGLDSVCFGGEERDGERREEKILFEGKRGGGRARARPRSGARNATRARAFDARPVRAKPVDDEGRRSPQLPYF